METKGGYLATLFINVIEFYKIFCYWKKLDLKIYYSFAGMKYWSLLVLADKIYVIT